MPGSVQRIREERTKRMQAEREERKRLEALEHRAEKERARQRELERERLKEQEKRKAAAELARSLDQAKEAADARRQLEVERIRANRRIEQRAAERRANEKNERRQKLIAMVRRQRAEALEAPAKEERRAHVPNRIAPQPDYDSIGMWRLLGEHFADEPAVLYDLYAAPHAALPDDLTGFDSDWNRWTVWIDMMVAELRSQHPRALCVVNGLDWGTDVSAFPILGTSASPIPNIVYGIRHFPRKGVTWPAVRRLTYRHPVFVTEWGGSDHDVLWGNYTAQLLRAEGIGWTAAHWTAETPLAQRVQNRLITTPFGNVVRHALALSGERVDATLTMIPPLLGGLIERNRFF